MRSACGGDRERQRRSPERAVSTDSPVVPQHFPGIGREPATPHPAIGPDKPLCLRALAAGCAPGTGAGVAAGGRVRPLEEIAPSATPVRDGRVIISGRSERSLARDSRRGVERGRRLLRIAAGDSRCTCLVVAIACLVLARSAPADCTSSGVHLNEVRYVDAPLPDGGTARIDASVELFNKGAAAAGLGGWRLADQAGVTRAVLAGTLSLPAGAYLEVVFGSGEDDLDFADGIGTIHTGGDSVGVFAREAGAVALYDAGNTIRDYVAWPCTGTPPAGGAWRGRGQRRGVRRNLAGGGGRGREPRADVLHDPPGPGRI